VTRRLLRFFLGREWVVRALKGLYTTFFEEISRIRNSNPDIREVMQMPVRPSTLAEPRINLLLPGLSERHVFGGIATALEFLRGFEGTAPHFRIIVTDESRLAETEHRRFPGWEFVTLEDEDGGGRRIVPTEDREQASLAVAEGDRFIATSWWTAHIARDILRQQQELFAAAAPSFIYLIQDFEPGFYPWSARYVLAEQTYQDSSTYVPVFNTGLLKDHSVRLGLVPADALHFDPVINEGVQESLRKRPASRERQVLVYGRPTVERNAFPLVVMSLRRLVAARDVSDWRFVSVGEAHAPVALGKGKVLESLGKLSINEYGEQLGKSFAGLSLMVSPHPSYPPLEMAAAGMRVVTNGYGEKDLSRWAENIISVRNPNPQAIADALGEQLARYGLQGDPETPQRSYSPEFEHYLHGHLDFSGLARAALAEMDLRRGDLDSAAAVPVAETGHGDG
jgi:hypothetical protein